MPDGGAIEAYAAEIGRGREQYRLHPERRRKGIDYGRHRRRRPERGHQAGERAKPRHAERMQLPYESAMIRIELARLKNPGDSGRSALLDQASATCAAIGASGLLKDTQALK